MAFVTFAGSKLSPGREQQPQCCRLRPKLSMSTQSEVPDVLKGILERKRDEITKLKEEMASVGVDHPVAQMVAKKGDVGSKHTFRTALNTAPLSLTVIAEIKRKSPSKGLLANIPDVGALSRIYYEGGAGAISVLTDEEGFGGTMADLERVVKTQAMFKGSFPGPCPVLRKDFIIDEVQIAEAAAAGASAVLLIMAALGEPETKRLLEVCDAYGLDALVEVHDEREMESAINAGAQIIGVNNRDLHTFDVDLETSFRLVKMVPKDVIKVAESGIEECIDAWKLRDAGFNAVLVGEALVKAYEGSFSGTSSYVVGYNQAKGLIRAFKAKGSVKFGRVSNAEFYGKGEGATERLGELSI